MVVHVLAHEVRASVLDERKALELLDKRVRRREFDQPVFAGAVERTKFLIEIEGGEPLPVEGVAARAAECRHIERLHRCDGMDGFVLLDSYPIRFPHRLEGAQPRAADRTAMVA